MWNSTRRLLWRPDSVSFVSKGLFGTEALTRQQPHVDPHTGSPISHVVPPPRCADYGASLSGLRIGKYSLDQESPESGQFSSRSTSFFLCPPHVSARTAARWRPCNPFPPGSPLVRALQRATRGGSFNDCVADSDEGGRVHRKRYCGRRVGQISKERAAYSAARAETVGEDRVSCECSQSG
jgi:hypothetical protein